MIARRRFWRHRDPATALQHGLLCILLLSGCGVSVEVTSDPTLESTTPGQETGTDASSGHDAPSLAAASPPLRISYPAADMDIVVHAFMPDDAAVSSRSLVPPETVDGYWLESFGSPGAGSTNTTYVMGHSWLGRDAPFNHLSTAAAPGDRLTVKTETGLLQYQVDSVSTYTKATLKDSPIWDVVPNRFVLISCFTEDPEGKNVVVAASPVLAKQ